MDERLKRMLQYFPPKKAVAVVGNATVDPVQMAMNYALAYLQNSLANKNIPVYWVSFASANDFQDVQGKLTPIDGTPTADVVLVCSDPLMRTYGTPFVQAAQAMGIRTMHEFAEWYKNHKGNLCFGPDFTQLFRNAAGYVDQIIGSAKSPAKLPIVPAKLTDCKQAP